MSFGHLRVPRCFVMYPYSFKDVVTKFDFLTVKKIKQNWSVIPLLVMNLTLVAIIPPILCFRLFYATIDVQLGDGYYRYEIPTVPRFFDLRKPRSLKLVQFHEIKPAVHLDNRYRLMRHEPMLDAEGQRTDKIGKDETAPPSMEELKKLREDPKFYNYYAPKRRIFFTR
ncbi:uncharacterized protein LOC108626817 isoform X1 [Ceratina calcarata]|uniref:Uncharacterized protein LOC108626817 isoform X1 n=1 Tax=Ceratina calcarata TaxID=156304 RepID=A0AAJ7S403_9HYME|nr:uncharacterized protein LOC108626817 isoform X1 [Ceratina calcarata]XP_026670931.1 uncharacterized protein LOC108626817 isoform X1 [Ceratina calcarata]